MILDVLATLCLLVGVAFFVAGMLGVIRFPDALCRLHAVTKADNLGLGLIVLGIVLGGGSPLIMVKLFFIWLLVLTGSATTCFLVALCIMRDESFPAGPPRADTPSSGLGRLPGASGPMAGRRRRGGSTSGGGDGEDA